MRRVRVGINGFGRMGRLALRAAWGGPQLELVHVNELNGDAAVSAHLLTFDSVQGRWGHEAHGKADLLTIDGEALSHSSIAQPGAVLWRDHEVDLVLECTGRSRTVEALGPYFAQGVGKVIVAAPVKDARALNVVVGVNDDRYDPETHDIVTAASCTTNCLAPVVKALHEGLGIERGVITTLHDLTNSRRWSMPHTPISGAPAPRPCR